MLRVATPIEALLIKFFLTSGFRNRETRFLSWYVDEADRPGVELLPLGLVAFELRQPNDAVTAPDTEEGKSG